MKRIFFLSSYPPRRCGIATFTENLINAVGPYGQHAGVVAVSDDSYLYSRDVVYEIQEQNFNTYRRAAVWLNEQHVDLVHIQHEFSLFGGNCGNWLLAFLDALRKPYIATLHTVSLNPVDDFGQILYEIGRTAEQVIVMSPTSCDILRDLYSVETSKISLIRHGAPVPLDRAESRQQLGVDKNYTVVSTFGLIGPNKGLEYAIEAIAKAVVRCPNIHFYILGQTHPRLITNGTDSYRNQLRALVSKLNIESHVHFVNHFMDEEILCQWLASSDIYITPYLNRYQSCSGPLTYATRFGKAIISTPYPYAQDLLAEGRGVIVDFDTLDSLSDNLAEEIIQLATDTDLRQMYEANASAFGKMFHWPEIGHQHSMLYESILT